VALEPRTYRAEYGQTAGPGSNAPGPFDERWVALEAPASLASGTCHCLLAMPHITPCQHIEGSAM